MILKKIQTDNGRKRKSEIVFLAFMATKNSINARIIYVCKKILAKIVKTN